MNQLTRALLFLLGGRNKHGGGGGYNETQRADWSLDGIASLSLWCAMFSLSLLPLICALLNTHTHALKHACAHTHTHEALRHAHTYTHTMHLRHAHTHTETGKRHTLCSLLHQQFLANGVCVFCVSLMLTRHLAECICCIYVHPAPIPGVCQASMQMLK